MVFTQHYCAKCASEQIRRNGHSGGRAKYQCKACGHQGYLQPAADAALKAAKTCGSQTVVMKFSAGTNLPTPWSSQQRIGCPTPPGSSGGKSAGGGPIVGNVLDPAKGAILEGVKK